MQKKYSIICLCFFITVHAKAQLQKDLARFAQTLQNVTQLTSNKIIIPTIFGNVEAPKGSTVEIKHNEIIVHVPDRGGDVLLPSDGSLSSPGNWVQLSDGDIIQAPSTPGGVVIVEGGRKVKVFPKGSKVAVPLAPVKPGTNIPATGIDIKVPTNGVVTLPNGEVIKVPVGSKVLIYSDGLNITVPTTGGDVQLSSSGGNIRVANMFNAKLELPNGTTRRITSNQTAQVPMKGVVKVIPENTLPSVWREVPFGAEKTMLVPGGLGEVKIGGLTINAPEDTTVRYLHDGLQVIMSPAGGTVITSHWGAFVGLPEGSPAVIVELSDGRKGEIAGGGYIIVPAGKTTISSILHEFPTIKVQTPEE